MEWTKKVLLCTVLIQISQQQDFLPPAIPPEGFPPEGFPPEGFPDGFPPEGFPPGVTPPVVLPPDVPPTVPDPSANPKTTVPSGVTPSGKPTSNTTMEGVSIVVAALESEINDNETNLITEFTEGDAVVNAGGYSFAIDIWFVMMEKLKFKLVLEYPTRNKNNPQSLRDLVESGKANASFMTVVYTNTNNTTNLVYTPQVDSGKYKLFIKTPTSETSWSSLGNVFRPVLWVSIAFSIIFMALTLIAIEHVGYKAKLGTYLLAPADTGQLVIIILGNFCYQGAISIASGCAGRVLIFTGLMCGYLVYISYSTLVISQLTAVKLSLPFETIQEMANKGTYKLMVTNDASVLEDIEISRKNKSNALASVWDKLLPKKLGQDDIFNEEVSALRKLCSQDLAILALDQKITTRKIRRAQCPATALRPVYFKSNLGFILHKSNPYNNILLKQLNRMREAGILHRWRKYWDYYEGLNREPEKQPTTLKPISLGTILPVLGIVGVGMLVSIVVLILEISYKRWDIYYTKKIRATQAKIFFTRPKPTGDEEKGWNALRRVTFVEPESEKKA